MGAIFSRSTKETCFTEEYFCTICQIPLTNQALVKCHCMMHLFQKYRLPPDDIIDFTAPIYSDDGFATCLCCQEKIMSDQELMDHLKSRQHLTHIEYLPSLYRNANTKLMKWRSSLSSFEVMDTFVILRSTKSACKACNLTFFNSEIEEHVSSRQHCENVREYNDDLKLKTLFRNKKDKRKIDVIDDKQSYMCFMCNKSFKNVSKLLQHHSERNHQDPVAFLRRYVGSCETVNPSITSCDEEISVNDTFSKVRLDPLQLITVDSSETETLNQDTISEYCIVNSNQKRDQFNRLDSLSRPIQSIRKEVFLNINSSETPKEHKSYLNKLDTYLEAKSTSDPSESFTVSEPLSSQLKSSKSGEKIELPPIIHSSESSKMYKLDVNKFGDLPKFDLNEIVPVDLREAEKMNQRRFANSNVNKSEHSLAHQCDLLPKPNLDDQKNISPFMKSIETPKMYTSCTKDPNALSNAELDKLFIGHWRKVGNKRRRVRKFRIDENLPIFADIYTQMCTERGRKYIYNIDEKTILAQTVGACFIIPYRSNLFCILCECTVSSTDSSGVQVYAHVRELQHIEHFDKLKNERTINVSKKYDDYGLATEFMRRRLDERILCYACDISFPNSTYHAKQHMGLEEHQDCALTLKEKSKNIAISLRLHYEYIWYFAQVFCCNICELKFDSELEFIVHLQKKHISELDGCVREGTQGTLDVCLACVTYWYGTNTDYSEHCDTLMHKNFLIKRHLECPDLLPVTEDFLLHAEKYIQKIVKESDKVRTSEQDREQKLLQSLEKIVRTKYHTARAYIFGSRLSHTGFLDSDVDVFLECELFGYYCAGSRGTSETHLKVVKGLIEEQENNWIIDEVLLRSRVPILKLRHVDTSLKCDISFINGLSVEKSKLIRNYNIASPVCRKMILYLKKWLDFCHLSGSEGVTSYALSWFIIYFLQNEGILPTVYEMLKSESQSVVVADWTCPNGEQIPVTSQTNQSLRELLTKFYLFYSEFDFQMNVICPFLGKEIPKRCFANAHTLPIELHTYKRCVMNNKIEYFRLDSPMCIQDPVDHSQNMTKAVSKFHLRCFMEYCFMSACILSE